MPTLPVNRLTPGMRIAREVRDRSGRLLSGPGRPISEQTIQVFQAWGVLEVTVEGGDDLPADEPTAADLTLDTADPECLREVQAQVDELFLHVDRTHPAAAALAQLITLRLLRQPPAGPPP